MILLGILWLIIIWSVIGVLYMISMKIYYSEIEEYKTIYIVLSGPIAWLGMMTKTYFWKRYIKPQKKAKYE